MHNASMPHGLPDDLPDNPPYGGDEWSLVEAGENAALSERSESLFSLSNGFIGVRGGLEDGLDENGLGRAEVYLNGVYESVAIAYHEKAHGFAETSDTRPPAANATSIIVHINGARVGPMNGRSLSSHRRLDIHTGVLTRTLRWQAPDGAIFDLVYERIVSLHRPNIMAQRVRIEMVSDKGQNGEASLVRITCTTDAVHEATLQCSDDDETVHDPRLGPRFSQTPWNLERRITTDGISGYVHRLKRSGIGVAVASSISLEGRKLRQDQAPTADCAVELRGGEAVLFTKITAYVSDFGDGKAPEMLEKEALHHLNRARRDGFDHLVAEQRADLEDFWTSAIVHIDGAPKEMQALRLNMFHVYQATGRGGRTSICAKGQTGEGYEGHYFWDAEIFCLPMLAFTSPALARDMLMFRCRTLPQSRKNARAMGHKCGALIAWRTIGGRESSAYFPAGSAQYHINADVAYALRTYMDATGDRDFLLHHGAELLFETARIWDEIGFYNPRKGGAFCINKVTGPDEYTALVDNNFYTNAMARAHLEFAHETAQWMAGDHSGTFSALCRRIGLAEDEIAGWKKAADAMYLPVDPALLIHPQDDSFLDRERWDIAGTPQQNFPLLLHYHPLTLYRYQVCKQADTVLAMVLEKDRFAQDIKARDLAYYEGVTVHDSTLSAAAFAMLASHVDELEKAHEWFLKSAFVDLADLHKNTGHGLHMASLGGSWMCLVMGFAGMSARHDILSFDPHIPAGWSAFTFHIRYRERILSATVGHARCHYRLIAGAPLDILHRDTRLSLTPDKDVAMP